MISFFTNKGYPTNLLTQAKLKANQHTQQTLLQNSKNATTAPYQTPFVTTYHPEINKFHNILKKNWTILSSTSRFGDCPLLSLRNNANLKKLLVRSNIHDEPELAGTFPCGRTKCFTCPHTNRETLLHCPEKDIIKSFTCTSKNIVYAIQCLSCAKVYIGETKRRLGDRFVEHAFVKVAKIDITFVFHTSIVCSFAPKFRSFFFTLLETDRGAEEPALDMSQQAFRVSGPGHRVPYQTSSRPTGSQGGS
ncbi:hypothetical protein CAPTEDRAFT_189527 [Capitella teleta]|uniref:GIY-YIG domain-containing protein n=1 Tax=Capitella teleta TaxID=283909 RepID=R7VH99_CAPTE|nr:hypothetical protein CAPTEDRAFT_189527 [Capitella teleta]|eukprot:ELU18188.1 hypothetical protein CAPTEDRAFT_189527 [Capitella teleta]